MPNTNLGLRQVVLRPVICRAQPQSEPGTAWGTPSVTTTGLALGALNTRRAAIRRIVGGAAKDLLIPMGEMVSGRGAESLDAAHRTAHVWGRSRNCGSVARTEGVRPAPVIAGAARVRDVRARGESGELPGTAGNVHCRRPVAKSVEQWPNAVWLPGPGMSSLTSLSTDVAPAG